MLFVPAGWLLGSFFGDRLASATPPAAIAILSAPLAILVSLALLYALGAGVTAHVSEFDFLMTSELRPREYLTADLLFQVLSVLAAGGLAILVASVSVVLAVGQPALTALPLLVVFGTFGFLVLMISQIFVVLRVRYPRQPVRLVIVALLVLSLLPSIGLARPDLSTSILVLPVPSTVFATLGYAVLIGTEIPLTALGWALVYTGAIFGAWFFASDVYIFHGVRPTLSAGFGQVDMASRLDVQRRLIGGLGGVTTLVRLKPERGGETGLMTRLHLFRIWRDGSVLFIVLFSTIALVPTLLGAIESVPATILSVSPILTLLLAVLAMNWSYYERENLWLVVSSRGHAGAYFRGLLVSFAVIGLVVSFAFLAVLAAVSPFPLTVPDLATPLAAPVLAAVAAAALLTRVKLRPAAFDPRVFVILFVVAIVGILGGAAADGLLRLAGPTAGIGAVVQGAALIGYLLAASVVGLWGVTRLAAGFRL